MKPSLDTPICTSASQLESLLATGCPMLVVFEKPDCEPCRSLPLEGLAREFAGRVAIVRVEDSAQGWLAARHHLLCVPTLLFWEAGAERARIKGNPGPEAIRAHLDFMLSGGTRPAAAFGPRHTLAAAFGPSPARPSGAVPRGLLVAR